MKSTTAPPRKPSSTWHQAPDMQGVMKELRTYIDESIQQHLRAEVVDLQVRLDRMETLLFHADVKTFSAIDAAISSASKRQVRAKAVDLSAKKPAGDTQGTQPAQSRRSPQETHRVHSQ